MVNGSGDISTPAAATGGETEEERIAAMFQANSEVWSKTQEHMATYVHNESIILPSHLAVSIMPFL